MSYKIDYEIILKGIEPFTVISSRIKEFLDKQLKDNLISGYIWKIKE